jgi:hypothetical protein
MSIQTVVEGQITAANSWASEARDAAQSALQALADVDVPSMIIGPIPYTPPVASTPDVATQPVMAALGEAPEIVDAGTVEAPTKPTYDPVVLGELLTIVIPDAPTITFPELDLQPPSYEVTMPANWSFSVANILITDDPMVQAAMTRLKNNITYGGTGLDPTVESLIFERDKEREDQILSDTVDKVAAIWAKRGWSLPDGMLAHALSEVQKEHMNKLLDRSREIGIEQAKLEQANLFKSIELAVNLVAHLVDLLIRYEELILRSQEDTAKFANEYIDIQIRTYAALLEAFRIKAQVHETMVRASLAKIEVFRAQLEGQKLIGDVNRQTVDIYAEQLKAHTIQVDTYKAEADVMTALLAAERQKIEANKLRLDAWAKRADVAIAEFGGQVDLYRSVSQQNISSADLQGRQAEATVRMGLQATELSINAIEMTNRSLQAMASLRIEQAKGVAQTAAHLAAGAMAGATTGASISYGESNNLNAIKLQ